MRELRDHWYVYNDLLDNQKEEKISAKEAGYKKGFQRSDKFVVLYDSLQLSNKYILNSFYGYVMQKGSRCFSVERFGIVMDNAGMIIRLAQALIDKVGLSS